MKKSILISGLLLAVVFQLAAQETEKTKSLIRELDSLKAVLDQREKELQEKTSQLEEQIDLMQEKKELEEELHQLEQEIKKVEAAKYDTSTYIFGDKKLTFFEKRKNSKEKESKKIEDQRVNHFTGIGLGVNGLLSENHDFNLQKEADFMEIEYQKSFSLSLYFYEHYFAVIEEKLGLTFALGFEFNNYSLDRNISLFSTQDTIMGIADNSFEIDKNRLKSTVINLPLVLETNLGRSGEKSVYLAAGGMISYRLGAKTKQIRIQNGEEFKLKNRTDFNMNPFLFSAVGRIGYRNFSLFANISLTSLYDTDDGPEIFPITIGVNISVLDQ